MGEEILLKHVVDKTDAIYAFISKRIIAEDETQLKQSDCSIIQQLDGLESDKGLLIEQCYEYFLMRLPNGIEYFLKSNVQSETLVPKFHGYLFRLFLKNVVIDFNRKQTRAKRKNEKRKDLAIKLYQHQNSLTQKEYEILSEYINEKYTQVEVAKKVETSRSTVNRAIKKLEKL